MITRHCANACGPGDATEFQRSSHGHDCRGNEERRAAKGQIRERRGENEAMTASAQQRAEQDRRWRRKRPIQTHNLDPTLKVIVRSLTGADPAAQEVRRALNAIASLPPRQLQLLARIEIEMSRLAMRAAGLATKIQRTREGTDYDYRG
jgi:hypothetical protein